MDYQETLRIGRYIVHVIIHSEGYAECTIKKIYGNYCRPHEIQQLFADIIPAIQILQTEGGF